MLDAFKTKLKGLAAKSIWAYGPEDVVKKLRHCGVVRGTTLLVHASWLQDNGFRGKPSDFVNALKDAVGTEGLLVMTSMPYHNMSSAQWLAKGKPMNVLRSPSMMGLLSEVFRRSDGVVRSLSATHPLLAWGHDPEAFVSGHENTERPFGPESPFARLLERNALILGMDAPFSTFTFTHFVEDHLGETLPVSLYDSQPQTGKVIDREGNENHQTVRVISAEANRLRREERLVVRLKQEHSLHNGKIGNTKLVWIRAQSLLTGAIKLVKEGDHFFDRPSE